MNNNGVFGFQHKTAVEVSEFGVDPRSGKKVYKYDLKNSHGWYHSLEASLC